MHTTSEQGHIVKTAMKQKSLATLLAAILLTAFANAAVTYGLDDEDTDVRLVNAKVVEVTDGHVSVVTRTGVEHVIAIDGKDTKVRIEGRLVSLKDLREGDVVTIELDEVNPVKFAKNIEIAAQANSQVARAKP